MTVDYDHIVAYHNATKHHFNRYARSAGYMDWGNQPNPFRFYEDAEQTALPFAPQDIDLDYGDLYTEAQCQGAPLNLSSIGIFCELSLGLSSWKQAGSSRWSLRINPSSGNLHPTEGYLVLPDLPGLPGGVFHYAPFTHALERRVQLPRASVSSFLSFYGPGFGVALTSISWRESWKYGERAYRYCNLDTGHALAALTFAARLNNWTCWAITGAGDEQIGTLLGMHTTQWWPLEQETPELLCWVTPQPPYEKWPRTLPEALVQPFTELEFSGRPNPLSHQPVDWAIIEQASAAAHKPSTIPEHPALPDESPHPSQPDAGQAVAIIRQRRSAVSFDPHKMLSLEAFMAILAPTLAQRGIPPFGVSLMAPTAHLLLFVHRVDGLAPGLYLLARGEDDVAFLRTAWRRDFQWQQAAVDMPLYLLAQKDVTSDAKALSCHQDIAGQSAFAVAMLAPFDALLHQAPYAYRHLHWECGMIGQVLYLGAEAHGVRGTGIGCFFDDEVHQLLGIDDHSYQCLYHFTVGHPVDDDRLTTLPPYHHLNR